VNNGSGDEVNSMLIMELVFLRHDSKIDKLHALQTRASGIGLWNQCSIQWHQLLYLDISV